MINTFIACAPAELEIRLVGATSDPGQRPLGEWQDVQVGWRTLPYLPIVLGHPSERSRVPLAFRYTWKLRSWLRRLDLEDSCLMFHRLEPALPTRCLQNSKVMFLHYHVKDQILHPKTEVSWGKFPWLYFALERSLLPKMDRLWSERQDAIEWWQEKYPALHGKSDFLPTWADDQIFFPRPEKEVADLRRELFVGAGLDPVQPTALFAGRFEGQKDPMLLLRAWSLLVRERPHAQLALAGAGSLQEEMHLFLKEEGLDKQVVFLGTLSQDAIAKWLNAVDVFTLSSAFEGMALAMIEALACGTPVVVTDVGEAPRVVREVACGRLVTSRDAGDFARALGEVLGAPRDPDLCVRAARPYTPRRVLEPVYDFILYGNSKS